MLSELSSTRFNGTTATYQSFPLYDEAGNRKKIADAQGAAATQYTYDALHRLVTWDPPNTNNEIHYGYDAAGNRSRSGRQQSGAWISPYVDYSYSPPSGPRNRLTAATTDASAVLHAFPQYDANGNPTSWQIQGGASRILTWDALDRLVSISGSFSASYLYDPLGRRIAKTEQGVTTLYQYDGLDAIAEYDGTSSDPVAVYLFGPGIDEPLRVERGATRGTFHTDGLGSILRVTNVSDGADLVSYKYDPFGAVLPPTPTGSFPNSYTYTGRERDASGLYYYRARYYLPEVGRFLTPDPIGLAGGTNPYSYVGSNPINLRDPFGLLSMSSKLTFSNFASPFNSSGSSTAWSTPSKSFTSSYFASSSLASIGTSRFSTRGFASLPSSQSSAPAADPCAGGACGAHDVFDFLYALPVAGRALGAAGTAAAIRVAVPLAVRFPGTAAVLSFGAPAALVSKAGEVGRTSGNLGTVLTPALERTVNSVLRGSEPLSALTVQQRQVAAVFFQNVATRSSVLATKGAAEFNIARARFLGGLSSTPPGLLAEFLARQGSQ